MILLNELDRKYLRDLTEIECKVYANMYILEKKKIDNTLESEFFRTLYKVTPALSIICDRLKFIFLNETYNLSPAVILTCGYFAQSSIECGLLWSYFLYNTIKNEKDLGVVKFASYFPVGIPNIDGYAQAWESQIKYENGVILYNELENDDIWKL